MKRRDLLCTAGASLLLSPVLGYAQSLPVVQACDLQQEGALLRVRLQVGTQVAYRSFTLADPARLVIDLAGVSTQAPRIGPLPDGTVVTAIRSGPHADGLRVVVDLARPVDAANARWDGTVLLVDLAAASNGASLPSTPVTAARIPARSVPMRATRSMWPWQSRGGCTSAWRPIRVTGRP